MTSIASRTAVRTTTLIVLATLVLSPLAHAWTFRISIPLFVFPPPPPPIDWNHIENKTKAHLIEIVNDALSIEGSGDLDVDARIYSSTLIVESIAFDPGLAGRLESALVGEGVDPEIAAAIDDALVGAFEAWFEECAFTHPGAYPSFVCYPGSEAPDTACLPIPLAPFVIADPVDSAAIAAGLASDLSGRSGGASFATEIAQWYEQKFETWAMGAYFSFTGSGPVPSWAPPVVPVGPVFNGTVSSGYAYPGW